MSKQLERWCIVIPFEWRVGHFLLLTGSVCCGYRWGGVLTYCQAAMSDNTSLDRLMALRTSMVGMRRVLNRLKPKVSEMEDRYKAALATCEKRTLVASPRAQVCRTLLCAVTGLPPRSRDHASLTAHRSRERVPGCGFVYKAERRLSHGSIDVK